MAATASPSVESFLRSESAKAIKELNGDDNAVNFWANSLIQAYTEPHRYYHTTNHIYSMLKCFEDSTAFINNKLATQLAIFFHDWVYDPTAHDNELQSIKVFETFAQELNIQEPLRNQVSHYIEATITHSLSPGDEQDSDLKHFLDFDLEVLSREPAEYALYASQIREEYGHFSDEEYVSGRVGVLEKLLGRGRLFFSDGFYGNFEERARRNLREEIAGLKQRQKNALNT